MPDIKPDWEQRLAKFGYADIHVTIQPSLILWQSLSADERRYWDRNIEAVRAFAEHQALNMLKGILKYEKQERTPDEWAQYERDEFVDLVNYALLKDAAKNT